MKLFEKKYHLDKHDYHVFAKMLKKYDILGYGLTIVYSIGLLLMAVLTFLYVDINEVHFKTIIIMQGFWGLYLLYSWTSGYKTTARAILNLFLHGYKDVSVDFYDDHLDIIYEDGSLRNLPYKNIQNIRRSNSFFIISFGLEYAFVNFDIDNEDDEKFVVFMGELESKYCLNKIDQKATRRLLGVILFSVVIIAELVLLIIK